MSEKRRGLTFLLYRSHSKLEKGGVLVQVCCRPSSACVRSLHCEVVIVVDGLVFLSDVDFVFHVSDELADDG